MGFIALSLKNAATLIQKLKAKVKGIVNCLEAKHIQKFFSGENHPMFRERNRVMQDLQTAIITLFLHNINVDYPKVESLHGCSFSYYSTHLASHILLNKFQDNVFLRGEKKAK